MRIVIVGGVADGMSCAARARRLAEDAEIIVLERGQYVSFAGCGLPYYVGGEIEQADDLLVQTPARLRAALNLDVRPGHAVVGLDPQRRCVQVTTPAGVSELTYDALVLAPGARSFTPPIAGLDSPRLRTLRTIDDARHLREQVEAGARRAVVLGAGFIGIEAAEALALRGLEVHLVEAADHVLPPLERELAHLVAEEIARLGITGHVGRTATAIDQQPDGDVVRLDDGTALRADLVILAVGVRPDTAAFAASGLALKNGAIVVDEHGRTNLPAVWAVGDATAVTDPITGVVRPTPLAGPANRAGRQVADHILRPATARALPAPLGTAVVRVGELTAATTGANRAALQRADREFTTLHLHPNQHAGYFPGATQLHLVVHIDPEGRLLGAQGVGRDGVEKRIDVLATALRHGSNVADLIDLDLCYAPPYGQAKDAVNLVGMVGTNVLDGTLRLWHAADLADVQASCLILDVRRGDEIATGVLPSALCIPHTELRARLNEVAQAANGRPVRVMCASGVRSALAHRVLTQHGLDSASLSGGMLTLRAWLGPQAAQVLQ